MSITKDQIIDAVASMSVMDIVELVTRMEERFNVSSINAVNAAGASTVTEASSSTEVPEEKTEFSVILKAIGANKIATIKAVRSAIGLGLKEAKDLVESAPAPLKEGISKDEAEILKKALEGIGAEVEVK